MNGEKVDLYSNIHRGIRNLVSRFALRAGAMDWSDAAAVNQLFGEWQTLTADLLAHHEHEERFIHPLLSRNTPGGAQGYEADHRANRAAVADLEAHLEGLRSDRVPAASRAGVGMEFFRGVNLFYAQLLEHMHREETEAQRALDALCAPQELAGALGAIMGSLSPDETLHTIDFMFPALSLPEVGGLLRGMKASAPPQAYAALADRVRQVRGEEDWPRLAALLP